MNDIDALRSRLAAVEAERDAALEAIAMMTGPHCPSCANPIDPDTCWCGSGAHNDSDDHGFVAMGCDCGRYERDWKKLANSRGALLHSIRSDLDKALARAQTAEAKAAVIGGEWCRENRADGRGPCGACVICCQEAIQRAKRAEANYLATQRESDRLRHGEPIESDFICPTELDLMESAKIICEFLDLDLEKLAPDLRRRANLFIQESDDRLKTKYMNALK